MKTITPVSATGSACDVHSEMLIGIAVVIIALLVLRFWVKRHPSKRKIRRVERKSTRHLRSKLVGRRGGVENVKMCSVCGDVRARCLHQTRNAEHAEGFHGPRKR